MLQLHNQTPFAANIAVFPDRNGIDTLYVIVKGTCTLRPKIIMAEAQLPVAMADEYHDDPTISSLKQCSDMHIGKPGTDVLLMGHAWAPHGNAITESVVTMSVAERKKSIRIIGDRQWQDGSITAPQPFESIPLVWERAFGGIARDGEQVFAEERNPIGLGLGLKHQAEQMEGQPLPNLEDPRSPLQKLGQRVEPVCFAPISPSWLPRRSFAGTYDENWQRKRAPYLPDDFDPRFLNCAIPEFAFDRYLQGGELIAIEGATPDAPIAFNLPAVRLLIEVTVAGSVQRPIANLETLLIEPDANRASLTWRAAVPCDRQVLKVEKIVVGLPGGSRT